MKLWKWFGVAGIAGLVAAGAVVARQARQRRAYTPDEIRARLHQRHAAVVEAQQDPGASA